jgi:hypothetical protein
MSTTDELGAARNTGRLIALWLLSGLGALAFIGAGSSKLFSHLTVVGGSPVPAAVLLVLTATIAYLRKA